VNDRQEVGKKRKRACSHLSGIKYRDKNSDERTQNPQIYKYNENYEQTRNPKGYAGGLEL
jgi:hypothetical protein